ncbi:hypothetical protein HDV01_007444 [Terramyces sp. JEL0728]|nr:hypothetical protein HDV01_007444 [Terramyces sp. JEL0728]
MAFNFGNPAKNTGQPAFGTNNTQPSGFSFGQPADQNKPANNLFGAPAIGANATGTTVPSFGFGANTTTAKPSAGGFGFGAPTANAIQPAAANTTAIQPAAANTTAAPAFGFGGTTATAAPAVKTTAPAFGAANTTAENKPVGFGGFNLGATQTPAKPEGNLFGNTGTPAPANTPGPMTLKDLSQTPAAPALFGAKPAEPAANKPAPASNLFGAPAAAATPALFATKPAAAPTFGTKPAETTAPLFGAKPTETAALFGAKPAATVPATTTSTASATNPAATTTATKPAEAAPVVGSVSNLKNKSLEDIINKWTSDLDTHTREFRRQAIQIQTWDHALVKNGTMITKLYNELQETENIEKEISQNLEFIDSQQKELDSNLDAFSQQIQNLVAQENNNANSKFRNTTPADQDREKAYTLAEHLNTKLDEMTVSLGSVISELNTSRQPKQALEDSPLSSIIQILNSHLTSLEWIEKSNQELEVKVEQLKRIQNEAEKNAGRILAMRAHHIPLPYYRPTVKPYPKINLINECDFIPTKNPVILCHGLFGFDIIGPPNIKFLQLNYWRGITDSLERNGCNVFATGVGSVSSIKSRAEKLHAYLEKNFAKQDVNLVAHSMGGLDCRYLISHIPNKSYTVKSLATIATPHRGSPFMDFIKDTFGVGKLESYVARELQDKIIQQEYLETLKVTSPKLYHQIIKWLDAPAFANLTREYCEQFNKVTLDDPSVYYSSYAACIDMKFFAPLAFSYHLVNRIEGDNDGLVSVYSAKWGDFIGVVECDHWDLVPSRVRQISDMFKRKPFKHINFYLTVVRNLALKGF